MKAELVPENGDPPIPITKDLTVVGRKECCDVCIDDASLSKWHCVLVKTDGLLVVRDLATTNGTKVKGQRIRWAALLPDDRLSLGAYKVRIYLGPDDVLAPSEGRGRTKRAEPAAAATPTPTPTSKPKPKLSKSVPSPSVPAAAIGFPDPSPLELPALGPADSGLEILDEEDDDSGWRNLIKARASRGDDILIELD